MYIDLEDQNIAKLAFSDACSTEEKLMAEQVHTINARHNCIKSLVGLHTIFSHLTEIRLSHNELGTKIAHGSQWKEPSAVFYASSEACDGITGSWIAALPPTLQVLEASHNHLTEFLHCHCSVIGYQSENSSSRDKILSQLRHLCPTNIALFFSKSRFPALKYVDISHNQLSASLPHAKKKEEKYHQILSVAPKDLSIISTIQSLDVSGNQELSCVNELLLCAPSITEESPLDTLNVSFCGFFDFFGLSAASHFAPRLQSLILSKTPLADSILNASLKTQRELLETVLSPLLSEQNGSKSPPKHMSSIVRQVVVNHLDHFASCLKNYTLNEGYGSRGSQDHCETLPTHVYAALVSLVVPSVSHVEGGISTKKCKAALIQALYDTIQILMKCKQGVANSESNATALTSCRAAVVADKKAAIDAANADNSRGKVERTSDQLGKITGYTSSSFPRSSSHTESEGTVAQKWSEEQTEELTKANARRIQLLNESIQKSKDSTRDLMSEIDFLRQQLTQARKDVREQTKQLHSLREKKEILKETVHTLEKRILKRRRELFYRMEALQSRKSKEAAEVRTKVQPQSKEKQPSAVRPLGIRKVRSEILRECAAKAKMEEYEKKHPYSYSPLKFKNEALACLSGRCVFQEYDEISQETHSGARETASRADASTYGESINNSQVAEGRLSFLKSHLQKSSISFGEPIVEENLGFVDPLQDCSRHEPIDTTPSLYKNAPYSATISLSGTPEASSVEAALIQQHEWHLCPVAHV